MEFSEILSLGGSLVSLVAQHNARRIQQDDSSFYAQQMMINQHIGAMNAAAEEMVGAQASAAIVDQTKRMLGRQINEFSSRGISLEGSPALVLSETATMGFNEAQNALFASRVKAINYKLSAYEASQAALSASQKSKYGAMKSTLDMISNVKSGYDLVKSLVKSNQQTTPPQPQQMGVSTPIAINNPVSNYFRWMIK